MSNRIRYGLAWAVSIALAVGISTMPGRAADGEKSLRKRIRKLERNLEQARTELAVSQSDMETLQFELADVQLQLIDGTAITQTLQDKLQYMTLSLEPINGLLGPHIIFTGCNVHIRSGSGDSVDGTYNIDNEAIYSAVNPRGLGNLIIGYNEQLEPDGAPRGGSHNLVIGPRHSYPKVCGAIFGQENLLTGPLGMIAGKRNESQGYAASVSGGYGNTASDNYASVSGGTGNTASGASATVTGGGGNTASGNNSSVSGGYQRSAVANEDWRAGSLSEDN